MCRWIIYQRQNTRAVKYITVVTGYTVWGLFPKPMGTQRIVVKYSNVICMSSVYYIGTYDYIRMKCRHVHTTLHIPLCILRIHNSVTFIIPAFILTAIHTRNSTQQPYITITYYDNIPIIYHRRNYHAVPISHRHSIIFCEFITSVDNFTTSRIAPLVPTYVFTKRW